MRRSITLLACCILFAATCVAQQLQQRSRYQLHPGDQLTVEYPYTPEYNGPVTVQPDGYISVRIGKDVMVAGKTLEEAKAAIEQGAAERLQNPVVVLTLTDFLKPYFVVAGEAFAPLKYEMRENMTVLQGLMQSGGIKITGKEKQVVLIHGLGTSSPDVHILDLKHVESKKILEQDMALNSGDIIFIPRNKITKAQQVLTLVGSFGGYANTAVYATH